MTGWLTNLWLCETMQIALLRAHMSSQWWAVFGDGLAQGYAQHQRLSLCEGVQMHQRLVMRPIKRMQAALP